MSGFEDNPLIEADFKYLQDAYTRQTGESLSEEGVIDHVQYKSDVLVAETDGSVWTCGDSKVDGKPGTEAEALLYSPN